MNKFFYFIALAVASFLTTACSEEEKGSYPPTYYGFDYYPKPVTSGDSVTIYAVQANKGKYLHSTDYQLTLHVTLIGNVDTTIVSKYHTNYDGTDNGNPTFKVKIPDNTISSTAAVSFDARWSNSCDGQGGTFYSINTPGYLGSINSYSYVIYSNAKGSFTLPIKQ